MVSLFTSSKLGSSIFLFKYFILVLAFVIFNICYWLVIFHFCRNLTFLVFPNFYLALFGPCAFLLLRAAAYRIEVSHTLGNCNGAGAAGLKMIRLAFNVRKFSKNLAAKLSPTVETHHPFTEPERVMKANISRAVLEYLRAPYVSASAADAIGSAIRNRVALLVPAPAMPGVPASVRTLQTLFDEYKLQSIDKVDFQLHRSFAVAITRAGIQHSDQITAEQACEHLLHSSSLSTDQQCSIRVLLLDESIRHAVELCRRANVLKAGGISSSQSVVKAEHLAAEAVLRSLISVGKITESPGFHDLSRLCHRALQALQLSSTAQSLADSDIVRRIRLIASNQASVPGQTAQSIQMPSTAELGDNAWRRANVGTIQNAIQALLSQPALAGHDEYRSLIEQSLKDYGRAFAQFRASVDSLHSLQAPINVRVALWLAVLDGPHGLVALVEAACRSYKQNPDLFQSLIVASASRLFQNTRHRFLVPRSTLALLAECTTDTNILHQFFDGACSTHQRNIFLTTSLKSPPAPLLVLRPAQQRLDLDFHGCSVPFARKFLSHLLSRSQSGLLKHGGSDLSRTVRLDVTRLENFSHSAYHWLPFSSSPDLVHVADSTTERRNLSNLMVHSMRIHTGYGARHAALLQDSALSHTSSLRSELQDMLRSSGVQTALVPHNEGAFDVLLCTL
jgi:hypothetical protein